MKDQYRHRRTLSKNEYKLDWYRMERISAKENVIYRTANIITITYRIFFKAIAWNSFWQENTPKITVKSVSFQQKFRSHMLRLRFHLGCQIFRIFNLWKYTFSVKDETIPLNITVFLFPFTTDWYYGWSIWFNLHFYWWQKAGGGTNGYLNYWLSLCIGSLIKHLLTSNNDWPDFSSLIIIMIWMHYKPHAKMSWINYIREQICGQIWSLIWAINQQS